VTKLQNDRGRDLRAVIMTATVELVNEQGLTAVAMSHVAERSGITRATLYKYFPDVRAILDAYQEQQVTANLAALVAARDEGNSPRERLERMLEAFSLMVYHQHTAELVVFLNSSERAGRGYAQFGKMLREVISEGARSGTFRKDVPAAELASFCTSALNAAMHVGSVAAARRLAHVAVSAVCAGEK
jgi:AcrR family transcriptional regulator